MSTKKLTIALDYDDVLGDCNGYAVKETNERYGTKLTYEDVKSWGSSGSDADKRMECFNSKEFFINQPLLPGAQEFVRELASGENREIFIITAISLQFMEVRVKRILTEFSEIKKENIIFANRKELFKTDILLDDKPDNILQSTADYRVLFRRPWNQDMTGMLSVTNYQEFLAMVARIERNGYTAADAVRQGPFVVSLVGPSGSGKTAIAAKLAESPLFAIPRSTTTRRRREGESENAYNFVSDEEFRTMQHNGVFLETTAYAGESYGTAKTEIEAILKLGKNAVMPLDVCGVNAMHAAYGGKAISVFVKRERIKVISGILERNISNAEKAKRLISLEHEYANRDFCDVTLQNNGTVDDAANTLFRMLTQAC